MSLFDLVFFDGLGGVLSLMNVLKSFLFLFAIALYIMVMAARKNNNVPTCITLHNGRTWMFFDDILYKM